MRLGTNSFGTIPAFTSDDLPEPLAPKIRRKGAPASAFEIRCTMARDSASSWPKKIGASSNSYDSSPRNGACIQIAAD
jgi:hypothetical protein